ncbi:MAG: VOC family protein [Patescibacteria group bacterium]
MSKLVPYIKFNDGKCREAMEFYKKIFGGKLEFMTIDQSPMAKDFPAEKQGLVMNSTLTNDRFTFMGSDMMRDRAVIGDNVGMALDCDSEKELDKIFAQLTEGGDPFMQPEDVFWGAYFGVITDKYGVEWMLNYQKKKPAKH